MNVGGLEMVGRIERVDVDAARAGSDDRLDRDMADCPGRNKRKDVPDLFRRKRRVLGSAQGGDDVRGRSPAFLMADQGGVPCFLTGQMGADIGLGNERDQRIDLLPDQPREGEKVKGHCRIFQRGDCPHRRV